MAAEVGRVVLGSVVSVVVLKAAPQAAAPAVGRPQQTRASVAVMVAAKVSPPVCGGLGRAALAASQGDGVTVDAVGAAWPLFGEKVGAGSGGLVRVYGNDAFLEGCA